MPDWDDEQVWLEGDPEVLQAVHPQYKATLETLIADEELPTSLHQQAEGLLQDAPDHAGAGP